MKTVIDTIWLAFVRRPSLPMLGAAAVGTIVLAYIAERNEIERVIRATRAELTERADEIESRMATARAGESHASYDPARWAGGEIAERLAGPAPVER